MSLVHSLNESSGRLRTATGAMNVLAINALEQMLKNNLESCAFYHAIAISQWRSLASVHDAESLRQCLADSVSAGSAVTKRVISDSQALLDIGASFKDELSRRSAPQ